MAENASEVTGATPKSTPTPKNTQGPANAAPNSAPAPAAPKAQKKGKPEAKKDAPKDAPKPKPKEEDAAKKQDDPQLQMVEDLKKMVSDVNGAITSRIKNLVKKKDNQETETTKASNTKKQGEEQGKDEDVLNMESDDNQKETTDEEADELNALTKDAPSESPMPTAPNPAESLSANPAESMQMSAPSDTITGSNDMSGPGNEALDMGGSGGTPDASTIEETVAENPEILAAL